MITKEQLKRRILSRLKTQERAYNKLDIYYTPRLYAKLVKSNAEHEQMLKLIYSDLIDTIGIYLVNDKIVRIVDIQALKIRDLSIYAVLYDGREMGLKDFEIVTPDPRHITIDHAISFVDLVSENRGRLLTLAKLTAIIRQGKNLNKENMRKEYARVEKYFPADEIVPLLEDIKFLASKSKLKLMPGSKNYSKGRRSE